MKFNEVLDALKNGERLTNATLSDMLAFIVRQVPQIVPAEVVPKMTSLPESAKNHINGEELQFIDQVLLVYWSPMQGRYIATSYIPTWRDIFREDWTIA
ncbi:MAG: hypothetical protein IJQ61_06230 [Bacteroidales bacterium]|nr:hypothetical protein [Bacteroidales bacterium]